MTDIRCTSPIDGSIYAACKSESFESVRDRVQAARAAQKDWAARPLAERIDLVTQGVARLDAMNDELVVELAWQMGRPVRYGGEMGGANERAGYMASVAETALAPMVVEDSDTFHRYVERVPLGVVLVVAPWNYPIMTAINSVVPALIAGNVVMLKHSSQTPRIGERLAEAFSNLPEGVFSNLFLTHEVTSRLIAARSFDFINFTGSVGGGQAMEKAAAGTFTALTLELGGKDPGYVRADADLDAAVETLIDGAMFNSGQCCCGIERIYVHESLFDAFVAKAVDIVSGYVLGNPLDEATTLGPMASKRFADVVRDQIAQAVAAGAKPLIDPALFPLDTGETAYLAPQILVDVSHDMVVMRDESFGPVVGIMKVSDDAEAVELMNDSPFGLTASIWTADEDAAQAIGAQIDTGTIFMNRCDYLDPALCWTGCKDTGRGTSLSSLAYLGLTRPKSFHLRKL
jgi:acyl-CoA reductase-like NAD-dependent aldehyde dehydrogenase